MFRRLFVALCVSLLIPLSTASAQTTGETDEQVEADSPAGSQADTSYVDNRLHGALSHHDLLDAWLEAASVSDQAALIELQPNAAYDEARQALLSALDVLAEHEQAQNVSLMRLGVANTHARKLDEVLFSIRNELVLQIQRDTVMHDHNLGQFRTLLHQFDTSGLQADAGNAGTDKATRIIKAVHNNVAAELAEVEGETLLLPDTENLLRRMISHQRELAQARPMLALATQITQADGFAVARERAEVVDLMPHVHQLRHRLPTVIDSIALVTVDAYVSAGATVDASCPVDWALLAAVGRIESRHGTTDDSYVQDNGQVSVAIFGPLLDGGATEREAEAAAAAAAEAAEIELQLAEEARIAEEEELAEFRARLYGEPTVEPEPDPTPVPEDEIERDIYGRDVSTLEDETGEDDESEDADGEEGDGEEEPELLGNGFAVIEDSDNGRLDRNDRWDRAVGPMQFIPETWSYMATDGNADGVVDPQNLYDAAFSAANFLCRLSVSRGSSPEVFILGYNGSSSYVDDVIANAERYRSNSITLDG